MAGKAIGLLLVLVVGMFLGAMALDTYHLKTNPDCSVEGSHDQK